MRVIKKTAIVQCTPSQMYKVVNDIESYPQFLPWCKQAVVHMSTNNEMCATLRISKGPLSKQFTTINKLTQDKSISINLVNGPFKHLAGSWQFLPWQEGSSTKILFNLEFTIANKLLDNSIGNVFFGIADTMVQAFSNEAVSRSTAHA